ncbi:lysine biosynthesis protein LysW [Candidatus Falkowbacteria bacterium CG_4_9_14_3_um_filter_36_9]|uniref:Lysine biosynthesis protein LysW n=1 Tax=Candidatus Falkowbacteria bacterium CG02_land_8_20_14_3_00_36_14 TaxID=1974560 RepID=A0A2M7DQH6_9BACT|nr:MAG: lysine biosynthesis protein LysW [Candidatus Falkowbacteria bacterium CG02_land_8_20_14_3_00_36_14]PIX11327.1 MAG: lysine biosynthesis protein LysW [Candidatus Falkowbacteria bacterium CG_4_8_14_3_um_filter_36_11]PJA10499.1 MAG: lysine biosynthesis protein LysW [Candidatus Falkowbacteria bacterium CG_4_10_14_0_2_um_filter_36_22]PJB20342.1 MAG: lysine biosynthesis protein LysW [Candidatus Falkowbacteria bacterium CG_4_9_14_3_um_filter_36_9]
MQTAKCPSCNSDVIIADEIVEGDLLDCANCEKVIEVASLHPMRLSLMADE